jgi:ribosomal protein S27AE
MAKEKRKRQVRFHNFPCPACGSVVRPWADGRGRVFCTNCRGELTQAVRGFLQISWLNRVREGTVGFATCGKCGTLVFAVRQETPEGDDEYWTCSRCGELVFV